VSKPPPAAQQEAAQHELHGLHQGEEQHALTGQEQGRAGPGTYGYSQDLHIHGSPFVLPSVYDQDKSDACILQAEMRRNPVVSAQGSLLLPHSNDPTIPCHPVLQAKMHTREGPHSGQHGQGAWAAPFCNFPGLLLAKGGQKLPACCDFSV
jgi:hypothetical protein